MRKLILVPMIHTNEEVVTAVRHDAFQQLQVDQFWAEIRKSIADLSVDFRKVKLFLEGVSPHEKPNFSLGIGPRDEIAEDLVRKGARIVGIENPFLYNRHEAVILQIDQLQPRPEGIPTYQELKRVYDLSVESHKLGEKRDKEAAAIINRDLRQGDIGMLLVGGLHRPQKYLNKDIKVEPLNDRAEQIAESVLEDHNYKANMRYLKELLNSLQSQRGPERR